MAIALSPLEVEKSHNRYGYGKSKQPDGDKVTQYPGADFNDVARGLVVARFDPATTEHFDHARNIQIQLKERERQAQEADDPGEKTRAELPVPCVPQRPREQRDHKQTEGRHRDRDRDGVPGLECRDLGQFFVPGLVPLFPPSLKHRVERPQHNQSKQAYDAGEAEPFQPVIVDGQKEVLFRQLSQDQAQDQRRTGPVGLHHDPSQRAKGEHRDDVAQRVVFRKGADVTQNQNERNYQGASHLGDFGDLSQKEKTDRRRDDVGNDNDPHEGKGQREMAAFGGRGQHLRSRNQTLDEKCAQQDRRADAAGNPKGDGRDHRAAQGRMVRCGRA